MLYPRPRQGGDVPSDAHVTGEFTISGTSGFCFVSGPPGQPEIDRIYWSSVGDYSGWTVVRNIHSCWYPRFNSVGLTGLETVYVAPAGPPLSIGDQRPFDGARFVCTDNQFLYFLDYSFTTPTDYTAATFQVKLQKLDLANYANVTTLATFHQDVNVDSISNLIYHPTTDSLWALTYQGVPAGAPNTGEYDRLIEINKNTGAVTVHYETFVDFNAGGYSNGLQVFNPMTYTPDAIWGVAYRYGNDFYSFRWDLATSTMSFGLQGLRPESAGVGLRTGDLRVRVGTNVNDGETIVHPDYSTEPVHPSRRSFRMFGAGTANHDWSRVLAPTTNLRPFGQSNQIWEWDDCRAFEEELVAATPLAGPPNGGGDLYNRASEINGYEPVGFDGEHIYAAGTFGFPTGAPNLITGDTSDFAGGIGDWTNVSYYGVFGSAGPAHATGPLTVVDGPTPGSKAMRCAVGGPGNNAGAAMTVPIAIAPGNYVLRATFRLEDFGEPPHYTDLPYGEWTVGVGVRVLKDGVEYFVNYFQLQIARGVEDAEEWFAAHKIFQVSTSPAATWAFEILFAVSYGYERAEAQPPPSAALHVANIEMLPADYRSGIARYDFPDFQNMTPYYQDPALPLGDDITSVTTDAELGMLYFLQGDFEEQKIMKYDLSQGPGGTAEPLYQFPSFEYNGPIVCNNTDHRIYTPVGGWLSGPDVRDRLVSFGPDGSRVDEWSAVTYPSYTPHQTPRASFDPPLWSMTTTEDAVWGVYVPVGGGERGALFRWDINRKQMTWFDPRTTPIPVIPYCLGLPDGSCLFFYQNDDIGVLTDTDLIQTDDNDTTSGGYANPTITQFRAIPVVDENDNVTLEVKIADQTNARDASYYWTLDGYANAPAPDYSYAWYYNNDSLFRIPGRSGWAWNSYWLG